MEQKLNSYYKNRNIQPKELKDTKEANKKRAYRQRQANTRNKETIRKRRYRQSLKNQKTKENATANRNRCFQHAFKNRTNKHRAIKKLQSALPRARL